MMAELVRLYAQIALLRRGPQDVPGAPAVLIITVLGYFLVSFVLVSALPPIEGPWVKHLIGEVLFNLAWFAILLRLVGKPERFVQTTSAVFGYQMVLAPLTIATGWLFLRYARDPNWQFMVAALALGPLVWVIIASSHVLKAALEWSRAACVMLVLAQIFAGQFLIVTLFPPAAPDLEQKTEASR